MSPLLSRVNALSSAEEILEFFGVAYDERVVRVNRLHILKRFRQYLLSELPALEAGDADAASEAQLRERCRALLQRAHDDFVRSSALQEKVFKVLQDAQGRSFPLAGLRRTLPSQAAAAPRASD